MNDVSLFRFSFGRDMARYGRVHTATTEAMYQHLRPPRRVYFYLRAPLARHNCEPELWLGLFEAACDVLFDSGCNWNVTRQRCGYLHANSDVSLGRSHKGVCGEGSHLRLSSRIGIQGY